MISFQTPSATLHCGDALAELRAIPADSVHMCVTSPPYWGLRAYGTPPQVWGGAEGGEHLWGDEARRGGPQGGQGSTSQRRGRNSAPAQSRQNDSMGAFCQCCGAWRGELGLEPTIDLYIEHMVSIFDEVRRVLRPDGTLWLNMGDSYACKPNGRSAAATKAAGGDDRTFRDKPATGFGALKEKDLVGQPWRIAFALQAAGWWLRSDIIWAKFNGMPNSVDDRPGCAHEYLFLLSKSKHYFYDWYAIRERAPYGRRQWSNVKGNLAGLGINGARGHATVSGEGDGWRNKRSVWTINTEASQPSRISRRVRVEADAAGGGIQRTTSPDCPIHGSMGHSHPTAGYDEPGDEKSSRNGGIYGRRAPEPPSPRDTIAPTFGGSFAERREGEPDHGDSLSATARNTRSHKRDRALSTSRPCNAFSESSVCTDDKSVSPSLIGLADHMPASSNEQDGSAGHPLVQTPDHSGHSVSSSEPPRCSCEYYREITEDATHFAAFPPDLVKPCILAGTSEYGCCAGCGKPYTRIVEKSGGTTGKDRNPEKSLEKGSSPASRADNGDGSYRVEHRGWKKPCRCLTDERTPGVCLDPFSGTGTVGLVALQLGRRYLGIELAEKYCRMQRKRLLSVTPPIPELVAL